MFMKIIVDNIIIGILFFVSTLLNAQDINGQLNYIPASTLDSVTLSPWAKTFQIANVQVPLILGSIVAKNNNNDLLYRSLRNHFTPNFSYRYADYIQYVPGAVLLGMKAFGVQGKNSWEKMLTADAFSILFTSSIVYALKYSTSVKRPDNSKDNSFPSGHTATAFMTATMLHIEYGDISPLISVGGYLTASAVGVSRILCNRHWMSDVLAGAGIGILSTELGYMISDAIFKNSKPSHSYQTVPYDIFDNQSFVGVNFGFFYPLYKDYYRGNIIESGIGSRAGIEGAGFFLKYSFIGLGGRATVLSAPIFVDNIRQDGSMDAYTFDGGVYFSYPLSPRWQISSKVICGITKYKTYVIGENINVGRDDFGFSCGTGLSIRYRLREYFGFRLFTDYDLMPPILKASDDRVNSLTLGGCFEINL